MLIEINISTWANTEKKAECLNYTHKLRKWQMTDSASFRRQALDEDVYCINRGTPIHTGHMPIYIYSNAPEITEEIGGTVDHCHKVASYSSIFVKEGSRLKSSRCIDRCDR